MNKKSSKIFTYMNKEVLIETSGDVFNCYLKNKKGNYIWKLGLLVRDCMTPENAFSIFMSSEYFSI